MADDFSLFGGAARVDNGPVVPQQNPTAQWPNGSMAQGMASSILSVNWPQTITQAVVTAICVYLAVRLLQKSPLEEWLGLA